ncbi:unnamed protein product [Soboliphyme baturini]|uniref:DZF domain-containing protein n=1 Tax=Soboliphyme baturini TaxID=241478 RepID=A0A183I8S2_9BILA|nr:unnamed protein product [Soboliphyme baturini]
MRGGRYNGYRSRAVFDLTFCPNVFPKVVEKDDSALMQLLLSRNEELTPTTAEQTAVMNLLNKVTSVIEKLIVNPDSFTAASIEEVKQVGSFKKGTMVTKHNVADIVVILKTLPTTEAANALGNRVVEDIKLAEPKEVLGCVYRDFGCEIGGPEAVVKIMIATIPPNMKKLDPTLHLNTTLLNRSFVAIRHARWFEENASHYNVKVLIRILKDIRSRFAGFQPMNPWMIDLLVWYYLFAYYATMTTPNRDPLQLNQAFRRCLQLLSAGIFLPGSSNVVDPCDPGFRVQQSMSLADQDLVCATAQTLLRVLACGGHKQILGLENSSGNSFLVFRFQNLTKEVSLWTDAFVTPSETVYEPPAEEAVVANVATTVTV